jgi:hypothetical protein
VAAAAALHRPLAGRFRCPQRRFDAAAESGSGALPKLHNPAATQKRRYRILKREFGGAIQEGAMNATPKDLSARAVLSVQRDVDGPEDDTRALHSGVIVSGRVCASTQPGTNTQQVHVPVNLKGW